mmetsp:Transcript_19483/g.48845  ORF Transcript_19483/g.48845 Transcript_19483/m.48845 type:complete len:324 (-) Transcript_19483:1935-2906(-)
MARLSSAVVRTVERADRFPQFHRLRIHSLREEAFVDNLVAAAAIQDATAQLAALRRFRTTRSPRRIPARRRLVRTEGEHLVQVTRKLLVVPARPAAGRPRVVPVSLRALQQLRRVPNAVTRHRILGRSGRGRGECRAHVGVSGFTAADVLFQRLRDGVRVLQHEIPDRRERALSCCSAQLAAALGHGRIYRGNPVALAARVPVGPAGSCCRIVSVEAVHIARDPAVGHTDLSEHLRRRGVFLQRSHCEHLNCGTGDLVHRAEVQVAENAGRGGGVCGKPGVARVDGADCELWRINDRERPVYGKKSLRVSRPRGSHARVTTGV